MKKRVTRKLETNVAELILILVVSMVLLSSCGMMKKPYHACGITELNKQYSRTCK